MKHDGAHGSHREDGAMVRQKWIALAEVAPTSACQELDRPAFVNVIGLATDSDSFVDLVRSECEGIDCRLVSIEDVEPWQERVTRWQPDHEVVADAASISDERPFVFGTFLCFPVEDVDE
jgi:hypothetical protein